MGYTIYAADCWCDACGKEIKKEVADGIFDKMKEIMRAEFPKSIVAGENDAEFREEFREAFIKHMDDCDCDSDDWPSSGHPEEATGTPQHCGSHEDCEEAEEIEGGDKIGKLLGTSLTEDGQNYVVEKLMEGALEGGLSAVEKFWAEQFSDYPLNAEIKVKVSEIEYDFTSDEDEEGKGPEEKPPTEMVVEVEARPHDPDDIAYEAADAVSDETGWLVKSAKYELLGYADKKE